MSATAATNQIPGTIGYAATHNGSTGTSPAAAAGNKTATGTTIANATSTATNTSSAPPAQPAANPSSNSTTSDSGGYDVFSPPAHIPAGGYAALAVFGIIIVVVPVMLIKFWRPTLSRRHRARQKLIGRTGTEGGEVDPVGKRRRRRRKGGSQSEAVGGYEMNGYDFRDGGEDFGPGGDGAVRSERHRMRQERRMSHSAQPERSLWDRMVKRESNEPLNSLSKDGGHGGYAEETQRLGEWKKGVPLRPLGADLATPGDPVLKPLFGTCQAPSRPESPSATYFPQSARPTPSSTLNSSMSSGHNGYSVGFNDPFVANVLAPSYTGSSSLSNLTTPAASRMGPPPFSPAPLSYSSFSRESAAQPVPDFLVQERRKELRKAWEREERRRMRESGVAIPMQRTGCSSDAAGTVDAGGEVLNNVRSEGSQWSQEMVTTMPSGFDGSHPVSNPSVTEREPPPTAKPRSTNPFRISPGPSALPRRQEAADSVQSEGRDVAIDQSGAGMAPLDAAVTTVTPTTTNPFRRDTALSMIMPVNLDNAGNNVATASPSPSQYAFAPQVVPTAGRKSPSPSDGFSVSTSAPTVQVPSRTNTTHSEMTTAQLQASMVKSGWKGRRQ